MKGEVKTLTVKDDIYVRLQQFLDRLGLGYPEAGGAELTFLKKFYSEEDAEIILQMVDDFKSAYEFSRMTGRSDVEEVEKKLYEMSKRGLIYRQNFEGVNKYRPVPVIHGTYEFNIDNPKIDKELLKDFFATLGSPKFGRSLETPTPFFRAIPIKKDLVIGEGEMMQYDDIEAILDNHTSFALCTCACRQNRQIRGEEVCDHPLETCLVLGGFAQYSIENGIGREVTREEAKKMLMDGLEDDRCINVINSQDVECICSCCECGCDVLRFRKALGEKGSHWSNYICVKDEEKCEETCSDLCTSNCQMKEVSAIESVNGKIRIDESNCIGCGMCANACPHGALSIVEKREHYMPGETIFDSYKEMNKYMHDIAPE